MNATDFDVAIIGAGPAGSTLAAWLARRGRRVVILDRDVFPRDKLCGEFLSYDALQLLGALDLGDAIDRAGAARIRTCRVIGTNGSYAFAFPAEARGISRKAMDDALLRHAVVEGAEPLEGWTADAIERDGDRLVVSATRHQQRTRVRARVVSGAWGRWGRFDRLFERPFTLRDIDRFFGFKRHYAPRAAAAAPPPDTIDLHPFDRGYLGVNWIEGGLTNICGLVHESRIASLKGGWPAFVERLRHERPGLDALYGGHEPAQPEFLSSEPVVFTPRSVVEGHVVLVGDAAGLIDPLAGNGMAMAIQSAALAAGEIDRFLGGGIDRATMERQYAAGHAALFARRIRWSRRVAWLLCRPRWLDLAMALHMPRTIGSALLERTRATPRQIEKLVRGVS